MSAERKQMVFATGMLALLCVFWGMTFPATKAALEITAPMPFLATRFSMAALLLAPFMLFRAWRARSKRSSSPTSDTSSRDTWLKGGLVGLFLFIGFALQVKGMQYTTASRSGFLTSLLTIFAPIIAFMFRTSLVKWTTWAGLAPAMLGIYLLADPQLGGLNLGDWLTIACAVVFASQMVVLEVVAGRKPGQKPLDVWTMTYAQIVVIAVGALLLSLIQGATWNFNTVSWIAAGYTAVFGSILAVWMQTRFQPDVPAGHAALVFTLEPVFASTFAWILLDDTWTVRGLIGAGCILFAMVLSSLGLTRRKKKPAAA